ncbi:MAG TPA: hypothetical protein VMB48_05485 [Steroidobacteraceae bacterium]|nr:hypothetical protein [Steroidobacteraceae bacterium]
MAGRTPRSGSRGRPATGKAQTAAQRMRRLRARRKAAGLKQTVSWVPVDVEARPVYSDHRVLEARSLAMHALIARKLARDPSLLDKPRRNLQRWSSRWEQPPRWAHEWRRILQRSWQEVAALITEPSERAARLRQSSPFAGVLTAAERARIYDAFRA